MKKTLCILMTAGILFTLTACAKTKALHCDNCGKEITVKESSDMDDSWLIYCEECNEELFGEDPLLGNG